MHKNYCVIGSPIAHSLSPVIHNALYARYDLDCSYGKELVQPETLKAFLGSLSSRGICGFNITMPLKQAILPYLDQISPEAEDGVNTVVVQPNGKLFGYSTDAAGFRTSLSDVDAEYKDRSIVFIGAGAVTKLLAQDAANQGANHIVLVNRTVEKAQKIAREIHASSDSLANLQNHMNQCDILINTTSLGMSGTENDFEDLSFLEQLPRHAAVCDLIYSPAQTTLLKSAASLGLETMNGLGMLIWQAFYAFEKWFGILPGQEDYAEVKKALLRHLKDA